MFNRRKKIKSPVLAEVLLTEFITKEDVNSRFRLIETWEPSAGFDEKVQLYKLALVLSVLLVTEQKNPTFKNVRDHLEKLVFSPDIADENRGMFFFQKVKQAMDDIADLSASRENSGQWMKWAISWLHDTGVNETNPVILFQFGMMWVDNYLTISQFLKKFDPR